MQNLQNLQNTNHATTLNQKNFIEACRQRNLKVAAQWFKTKPTVYVCEQVFGEACESGHLEVAQWLLKNKPNINVSFYNDETFRGACSKGHLEVAQWLFKIKPDINISALDEYAFRWACLFGHLKVAQWLLEIKPDINISAWYECAFREACENGHLELAQWLQSLRPWLYKIIIINNNDNTLHAHINTPEEQRFERRKYVVWLYSLKTKINKECVFHKLPNELLRVIAMTFKNKKNKEKNKIKKDNLFLFCKQQTKYICLQTNKNL